MLVNLLPLMGLVMDRKQLLEVLMVHLTAERKEILTVKLSGMRLEEVCN